MEDAATSGGRITVDAALLTEWRQRHRVGGSTPRLITKPFASVETALVFDWSLRRSKKHALHPEARKFAICLSSRLQGRESKVEASEADIERWGIDGRSLVPDTGRTVYRQPWALLTEALKAEGIIEDLQKRPDAKRLLHLRLVPVSTNRRGKIPVERPTEILKSKKIPTVAVPAEYFIGDVVGTLPPSLFFAFVTLHALTDMVAWGGVDPYHLRVEGDSLHVSNELLDVLDMDASGVLDALVDLTSRRLVNVVPATWRFIQLPSSGTTFEWTGDEDDGSAGTFVVRPTVIHQRGPEIQADKREWADESPVTVQVSPSPAVGDELLAFAIDDVFQIPQYDFGSNVVGDRMASSVKSQIAKAAPASRLTNVDVALTLHTGTGGPAVGLVHSAKTVVDAFVRAGTITDDSRHVLRQLTVSAGKPDAEGRPYVHVQLTDRDGGDGLDRKYYVQVHGWRPPARRRTSSLSACWNTYSGYVASVQTAARFVDLSGVDSKELEGSQLTIKVRAPKEQRFDLDNVALFVVDLLTEAFVASGMTDVIGTLIHEVIMIESEGDPGVRVVLKRGLGKMAQTHRK